MAKQLGPYFKVMCKQNIQFYKMDGKYYARMKSSLTRERVLTDKAFTLTRVYSSLMAQASPIASAVYQQIPEPERHHDYFNKLVGEAQKRIKKGMTAQEVYQELYEMTFPPAPVMEPELEVAEKTQISYPSFADEVLNTIFSVEFNQKKAHSILLLESLPP
jgi:hypothetical protein